MSLVALSPLDGRYAKQTATLGQFFSESALMHYRVLVEVHYFIALIHALPEENLSADAIVFLNNLAAQFSPHDARKIKDIEAETHHDVKAVEYFLVDRFKEHPELKTLINFIHFGLTSEDINNLAYALMLNDAMPVIIGQITAIKNQLTEWAHITQDIPMLARTHGQSATPTNLGHEFQVFEHRLSRQILSLEKQPILGKLGGATGGLNAHKVAYPEQDWRAFAKTFVQSLGIDYNAITTQIEPHDFIAEIAHNLSRINTLFIDLSRDIWQYISLGYFIQKTQGNEVGSSTMPHKINPIDFENAEGNFGLSTALFEHFAHKLPISRLQRDLSDSTVMRSIGSAFGYQWIALLSLAAGLKKISPNISVIREDLNLHPEVLAEAIQTVLRKYRKAMPYETLKTLTRGKTVTLEMMHQFIDSCDLPAKEKERLKKLNPENY